MVDRPLRCPKCANPMDAGFLLRDESHQSAEAKCQWVEGMPVKSFWGLLKLDSRSRWRIKTFRCVRCGYIESYAMDEVT
jgi:hypothetical protein